MSASGDKELTWLPQQLQLLTVLVKHSRGEEKAGQDPSRWAGPKKQGSTQVAGQDPRSRTGPKLLGRTQEAGQDPNRWAYF
eukprot:1143473-Pelagomonas_calceolata.AAC.3